MSASWPSFNPNRAVAGLAAAHGQRARQPRHAGPLSAGLVDQARDRRARARERSRDRRDEVHRSGLLRGVRQEDHERQRRALLGQLRSHLRAHALHQQRLRAARQRDLRRPRRAARTLTRRAAEARLLLDPAARLPDRPARRLGHGPLGHAHAALAECADRPRAHGHRSGQPGRDAAADGDGRGHDRQRRRRHAADARRLRSLARAARCATSATASRSTARSASRRRRP